MNVLIKPAIVCMVLFLNTHGLLAQELTAGEADSAVLKMATLLSQHYVFPEQGMELAAHLRKEYRRGAFSVTAGRKTFADAVTQSLQDAGHDGHLYLRYDPEKAQLLLKSDSVSGPVIDTTLRQRNYGFREVKILEDNTGYLKIEEICFYKEAVPILLAAMQLVAGTKALIIDLRGNSGGGGNTGTLFESIFLPPNTTLLEFQSRNGPSVTGKTLEYLPADPYKQPLYLIIDENTASAAEYYAYVLQLHHRATIVGQRSAGGAHMSDWYPINDYFYFSVSTAAPTVPGTSQSWEQTGVQPDIEAAPGEEIKKIQAQLSQKLH